jgi:hypothetical protein
MFLWYIYSVVTTYNTSNDISHAECLALLHEYRMKYVYSGCLLQLLDFVLSTYVDQVLNE